MTYSQEQRLNLRRNCGVVFPGFHTDSPADEFRRMADWCAVHDVVPDIYGDGKLIGDFERKIADLLGKSAAAFMPSGMMAQLCALLIWTRRAGLPRFGMHPTSHLAHHEQEAYQALFQFHGVPVGDRLRHLLGRRSRCGSPAAGLSSGRIADSRSRRAIAQLARAAGPERSRRAPENSAASGWRPPMGKPRLLRKKPCRDRGRLRLGLCLALQGNWRPCRGHSGRRRGFHRRSPPVAAPDGPAPCRSKRRWWFPPRCASSPVWR